LEDVTVALCAENWRRDACDVHHPEEVRLDLFVIVFCCHILDRIDVGVARVIDEHVEPAKGICALWIALPAPN
jgi:hypothetical protein